MAGRNPNCTCAGNTTWIRQLRDGMWLIIRRCGHVSLTSKRPALSTLAELKGFSNPQESRPE